MGVFYSINAQMKAVIDRTVARWLEFKNKEFYYIMTAAEDEDHTITAHSNVSAVLLHALRGQRRWG